MSMVICDHADTCSNEDGCRHKREHLREGPCNTTYCAYLGQSSDDVNCVPPSLEKASADEEL